MKNRKSPRQKAAAHGKGLKKAGGLRKGKTTSHPRWLAPRPYFAPAFLASPIASSGGSSGVNVTMVGRDLGIDKQGYRQQSQDAPSAGDNRYSWIHQAPQRDLTLPHDTTDDAGNPIPDDEEWPNYWTMMVKVTPADRADQITFEKHGDEDKAVDYFIAKTDTKKGEIRVRVTAKVPTTAITKNGKKVRRPTGALIVAIYKGVKVAQANFYVIRPDRLKREPKVIVPGTITALSEYRLCAEYEGQGVKKSLQQHMSPPAQSFFKNYYFRWIEMQVLDQYNEPLANFYSGTAVSENQIWMAWSNGPTYLDPVGYAEGLTRPAVDSQGYKGIEYYELSQLNPLPWVPPVDVSVVRVAGWLLNNGNPINRELIIRDGNPPSPNPGPMPFLLHYFLKWL